MTSYDIISMPEQATEQSEAQLALDGISRLMRTVERELSAANGTTDRDNIDAIRAKMDGLAICRSIVLQETDLVPDPTPVIESFAKDQRHYLNSLATTPPTHISGT